MSEPSRTILHVDLDAFFAAVEVREDPALEGVPLIIGADPKEGRGRGVVCTASYEARQFGVRSAMPISEAWRRCPQGVFRPPRMALYSAASSRFMSILHRYTDLVEPLSVDEAFLDVTPSRRLWGDGPTIAARIREEVRVEEQLVASVGVAPTKFVAKIASDLDKPDGLVVVPDGGVQAFLEPLPVARLFGAGKAAQERFRQLGLRSLGDVARSSESRLIEAFGESAGRHFHQLARGFDPRDVVPDRERKSLGKETTFERDVDDRDEVRRVLLSLAEDVARSLRAQELFGRHVAVKLRTSDFKTVTRGVTVPEGIDSLDVLGPTAIRLLERADRTRLAIRLVGVSVSKFGPRQRGLFEAPPSKRERLDAAEDALVERFGPGALRRGATMRSADAGESATRPNFNDQRGGRSGPDGGRGDVPPRRGAR